MVKKPSQRKPKVKVSARQTPKRAKTQKKTRKITRYKQLLVNFLNRRPHRSFRRTEKRDYQRPAHLPGYFAFTKYVLATIFSRKYIYLRLLLTSSLATIVLVGASSQDSFATLSGILSDSGTDIFEGGWGEISKAGLLLMTAMTGNLTAELTEAQQIFAVFIGLCTWLALVWLLRAQLAGQTPRLRDALYNSGSPIIPTTLLFLLLMLQALPAGISIIAYTAAVTTGFITSGVIAMVFALASFLLVVLSLYLVTSTFLALVIVTLPGMYPWQALRAAGDIVLGRRLRILLRLIWMALVIAVLWSVVMIPVVLFATWLQNTFIQTVWVPIVPVFLVFASSAATIFAAAYVYLLYRKIVDNDSSQA